MTYFHKQTFRLSELVPLVERRGSVLIVEPQRYRAGLYKSYLTQEGYEVAGCHDHEELFVILKDAQPQLVVVAVDAEHDQPRVIKIIRRVREDFPSLHIVSIAHKAEPDIFKELLSAGISSHIDRAHTRPQDVVVVVNALLQGGV